MSGKLPQKIVPKNGTRDDNATLMQLRHGIFQSGTCKNNRNQTEPSDGAFLDNLRSSNFNNGNKPPGYEQQRGIYYSRFSGSQA